MAMLADQLKQFLTTGKWPQGNDHLMERPAMEGDKSGRTVDPQKMMQDKAIGQDPANVKDENGNITDYRSGGLPGDLGKIISGVMGLGKGGGNPFSNLLRQNQGEAGRGSIMGLLSNFLSPEPERNNPNKPVQGYGTVGGGDPSRGTPGSGVDPGLNPTPSKDQKVPAFAEKPGTPTPLPLADQPLAPAPIDYAMPAALNPQQIEELRSSLLTASGQMNVANPNSLMGRMASPNSAAEMRGQMSDAEDISNAVQPLQKGDRQ